MPIHDVLAYAQVHDLPVTAISTSPHFDDKKGRVSKGDTKCHMGWRTKNRWERKNTVTSPKGGAATAWMMRINKADLFVVDIDVKNGRTAREVMVENIYEQMMEKCLYVVETGSKGLHFYHKRPSLKEGEALKNNIKCDDITKALIREEELANASVDIIVDSIVVEGSSYTLDAETYRYMAVKSDPGEGIHAVDRDVDGAVYWEGIKHLCIETPSSLQAKQSDVATLPVDAAEIAEHVRNIPNARVNWEEWYRMAQIIHNLMGKEAGMQVFLDWSAQNPIHDERKAVQEWRSLQMRTEGKQLRIGSLFHLSKMANENGYHAIRKKYKPLSYWSMKEIIEQDHFFCEEPEPCFVRHYGRPQMDGKSLIRYSDRSFRLLMKAEKVPWIDKRGEPCERPFYDVWSEDRTKRTYKRIGFYPDDTECPTDVFNSYLPPVASFLPVVDGVDIGPILQHFDVMANHDPAVASFLIKYFAQIVQQPSKLPGIAVLLIAQEGAGKDIVADWIGKAVLGGHQSIKVGKMENLVKNFNSHMSGRFLVHSDECLESTMRTYHEDLKRLITNTDQFVERKGIDGGTERNYARLWQTVNPPEVLRYISPTDRRFLVTRSSSEFCGNDVYFNTLLNCMHSEGTARAFYDYLMAYDISDFTQANRPVTALFAELKANNVPPVLQWIVETDIDVPQRRTTEWLGLYNMWAVQNRMKEYNITTFGIAVNDMIAKGCGITLQKPKNVSHLTIDRNAVVAWMETKGFL